MGVLIFWPYGYQPLRVGGKKGDEKSIATGRGWHSAEDHADGLISDQSRRPLGPNNR